MKTLVENFINQLKEAMVLAERSRLNRPTLKIENVVIAGMGGSGIGGTIVSELVKESILAPIEIVKGYFLPAYVNEKTLVIVSSYSGNTEETLKCFEQATQKGSKVVGITSGGQLAQIADAKNIDLVLIPGGMPPRAALGYSLVALFYILNKCDLIDKTFQSDLTKAIELLVSQQAKIQTKSKELASQIFGKMPIVYAQTGWEGISTRWRQQFNENAKMLGWQSAIPEMNHNELMGWSQNKENLVAIFIRDKFEYDRIGRRIDFSKKFIEGHAIAIEAWTEGQTKIEKALYLINLGDWVSVHLAEMRQVDPNDITVIEELKKVLAE